MDPFRSSMPDMYPRCPVRTFIIFIRGPVVSLQGHSELSWVPADVIVIDSCRCFTPNGVDFRLREECHFGNDDLDDFVIFPPFV
ncbi:hypothetical protein JTE90_019938 [Oedothorax gibbosus]|uniref:Uncharacterized protein n=1 Tax=Oedothorax gibbosus TaxID=931172 RepID=A0AAV6US23_9ARAC|nr:hypothetical protein JTE90_019938 [Oedothorax gibbosus]